MLQIRNSIRGFVPSFLHSHLVMPLIVTRNSLFLGINASGFIGLGLRNLVSLFSTSTLLLSGLSRHNTHPSSSVNLAKINNFTHAPFWDPDSGKPLPEAVRFFIDLPSIHAPDFFESVYNAFQFLNNPQSGVTKLNVLIECIMEGNRTRSLRESFLLGPKFSMQEILNFLTEAVEKFEAQSGSGEEGPSVIATRARVVNISSSPNPEAIPFLSDPANVQWRKDEKADRKASKRPTLTLTALNNLETKLNSGFTQLNNTLKVDLPLAIAKNITENTYPTPSPIGVNWTPIIQGLVSGLAKSFGAEVQFPSQTPGEVQVSQTPTVAPSAMEKRIANIESTLATLATSSSSAEIAELKAIIVAQNEQIAKLSQAQLKAENKLFEFMQNSNAKIATLAQTMNELANTLKVINTTNNDSNNGNSTPPTSSTPTSPKNPPFSNTEKSLAEACALITQEALLKWGDEGPQAPEFTKDSGRTPWSSRYDPKKVDAEFYNSEEENLVVQPKNQILEEGPPTELVEFMAQAKPFNQKVDFKDKIVTADLEAIITPEGINEVYMAAWYNSDKNQIFHLDPNTLNKESFLKEFWINLIEENEGKICYYHNWGGYDSILSLPQLLNCKPNLSFNPIMKNGELMCLEVKEDSTTLITIKDSLRVLPSSLSKLAKDWKVETMKDHFPHYYYLNNIKETLLYSGPIPEYQYFEPKRTSRKDYEEMLEEFRKTPWSFLEVSKKYIMSDCKALYQVLIKFFESVLAKFPIDPTLSLSAPSVAFKIWRTVQMPTVGKLIADFSNTKWDTYLRQSYNGGIVDVYKFHLTTKGYYYDVNSLYPTAMCRLMPVGTPTKIDSQLWGNNFFGFVDATVQTPANEYLGLLSIKYQGRLICPGGTFRGLFFSEELKFALAHEYQIIKIHNLLQFEQGAVFEPLIRELNEMKIQAQEQGQPTIRNLAKLLMNSMYGRFGMHTTLEQTAILNSLDYLKYTEVFAIISELIFGDYNLIHYKLKTEIRENLYDICCKWKYLVCVLNNSIVKRVARLHIKIVDKIEDVGPALKEIFDREGFVHYLIF